MAALGVADFRQLGGPGRFRDSGMVGTEPNLRPDSFWQSDLLIAATELVSVIREVQPQVVVGPLFVLRVLRDDVVVEPQQPGVQPGHHG